MMSLFKLNNNTGSRAEANICFINAAMQALNSLDYCREFFVNRDYDPGPGQKQFPICDELSRLFKLSGSQFTGSAGALRTIIGRMSNGRYSYFNDGSQQDSGGFLEILLNSINEEVITLNKTSESFIKTFQGQQLIVNNFVATPDGSCPGCKSPSITNEQSFLLLPLAAKPSITKQKSIQDLFSENFDCQSDLFRKRCEDCQNKNIDDKYKQFARSTKIVSCYPDILILQVQKFTEYLQPLKKNVFPEDLLTLEDGDRFELTAIISHLGESLNTGHYITYVKRNQKWYECNDAIISEVTKGMAVSDNNCIYFYQRQRKLPPYDLYFCKECNRSFKNLKLHLLKNESCRNNYDMQKLTKEIEQLKVQLKGSAKAESAKRKRKESLDFDFTLTNDTEVDIVKKQKTDLENDKPLVNEIIACPQEFHYDLQNCIGCKKNFNSLMSHLKKVDNCKRLYDLDELKSQIECKRKANKSLAYHKRKAEMSEDEMIIHNQQNKINVQTTRANQSIEKKDLERSKNKNAMASTKAKMSEEEKIKYNQRNKISKQTTRANQSIEKKDLERSKNKNAMATSRANQSEDKKMILREKNTDARSIARDNITLEKKQQINEKQKIYFREKRIERLENDPNYKKSLAEKEAKRWHCQKKALNLTIQGRKRIFNDSVKSGPIFVCICCKRTLYDNAVIPISLKDRDTLRNRLNNIRPNFFEETIGEYPTENKNVCLCFTCKNYHLFKGFMPPMCHSNNLETHNFNETPWMRLSELENSLIALDLLFMKVYQLPRSRMSAIKDQVVNIPLTDLDIKSNLSLLPRTPDEAVVIPVQLKRKQALKNAHLEEFISPSKIRQALTTLKSLGHPHYQFDFECNMEDFERRMAIEAELLKKEAEQDGKKNNENSEVKNGTEQKDDTIIDTNINCISVKDTSNNINVNCIDVNEEDKEKFEDPDHREHFQFDYNLNTVFADDHPEMNVIDKPITLSPGEGKIPIGLLQDQEFDMKSHPFLDPSGQNNMCKERKVELTAQQFFEQRILNVERIFSDTPSFVFAAVNYIERKQINSRINVSFQRGKKKVLNTGEIEYSLEDAFSVLDKMKGTPKYWKSERDKLFAKLENLGPFQWFFTLSCADYRYQENFSSILQDHNITYILENGEERCLIDGLTIEEFLSNNESKHEFIRKNTLTATRNFYHRLKMFVKNVIMNPNGPMHVKYHSYRIEFQLRGAAHCHGVLWIDLDAYLADNATDVEKSYLLPAFQKLIDDIIPGPEEETAVVTYVDKFVTCSLQDPMSRDIAQEVNCHKHSHTCHRYGGVCRFDFPRYPCLYTILAKPLRLTHAKEEREEAYEHLKQVLLPIKEILEDAKMMEALQKIRSSDLERLYELKLQRHKIKRILDDPVFLKQVKKMKKTVNISEKKLIGHLKKQNLTRRKSISKVKQAKIHLKNLECLKDSFDEEIDKIDVPGIMRERLLAVLKAANIMKTLHIDESLDETAQNDKIIEEYHKILAVSTKGFCVRLRRDIAECYINNFSHEWISIFNSNMDLSPVFDFYSTLCYIGEYVLKGDKGMTEFIMKALKEQNSKDRIEKLRLVSKVFLTHRQMGMCEAYYRILPNLNLVGSNIGCEFLATGTEKSRFLTQLKEEDAAKINQRKIIKIAGRDGDYVESISVNDKYKMRPEKLKDISLIQFAKRYVSVKVPKETKEKASTYKNNDIDENFIICRDETKRSQLPQLIELTGEFLSSERQCMRLRRPIVIRLHKYKKDAQPHEFYFSELELFHVFESPEEEKFCKENLDFCLAVYENNIDNINYVKSKTMPFLTLIEKGQEIINDANMNEVGEQFDPQNQQLQDDCGEEDVQHTDKFISHDYVKDTTPQKGATGLFKRVELEDIDELNKMTRNLDVDQKFVIDQIITYIKQFKRAKINSKGFPDQLQLIVVGGAGTGKSHVINLIAQWVEHFMRDSGDHLHHPYIVRCAVSGTASANISGQTIHSTLSLDFSGTFMSMGDKKKDQLRTILTNLMFLIIDEFSMVKSDYIFLIHTRLQEIKQVYDKPFGGVCVLFFGDPMQLRPVKGTFPWEAPKMDNYRLYNSARGQNDGGNSIWQDFTPIMLKTNHRQGAERVFADVLNRLRVGEITQEDKRLLQTRVVPKNSSLIPKISIYVFPTNAEVNFINESCLSELEGEEYTVEATVRHRTNKNFRAPVDNTGNIHNTNLQKVLKFKLKSKVVISVNICTADGITNGTFAEIVDVDVDSKKHVRTIFVHFLNPDVGKEKQKEYGVLERKYGKPVIPIERWESVFSLDKSRSSAATATALQFPIKLATAVTAHKVQGQTVKPPQSIVMNIEKVRDDNQVYVMLSRAQKLEQVFILDNLYLKKWKTSESALQELKRLEENSLNFNGIGVFDVACLNVRSLLRHFEDIKVLRNFHVKVMCLQETWLDPLQNSDQFQLEDFNVCLNSKGRGKGIATYYSQPYFCDASSSVCEDDLQMTKVSNESLDIINVYRSSNNKSFKEKILKAINPDKPTILCGDINCEVRKENLDFIKTLEDLRFVQIVQKPTHDMGRSIDVVYVNQFLLGSVSVKQMGVGFSDHDCLLIKLDA